MNRMLVAFSGKIGSGKTTCAQYLETRYDFKRVSFAHALKRIAVNEFGWDGKKDGGGRKLLQKIGEVARDYLPNIWIEKLEESLFDVGGDFVVIDDCRYVNEAEWVRSEGGFLVRIDRHTEKDTHISETSLDEYEHFDSKIPNKLDKMTLFREIDKIIKCINDKEEKIVPEAEEPVL